MCVCVIVTCICKKNYYSFIKNKLFSSGTCDHTGKFIDVFIGRPGRAHDASVFRSSTLFTQLTNPENAFLAPNQHLLGDSAYLLSILLINIMTPFKDNGHLTRQQINFNMKHASMRSIIERAFGLLKVKFRRLQYLNVKSVKMAIKIVSATCTLHNFILIQNRENIRPFFYGHNNTDDARIEIENVEEENENVSAIEKRYNIMNSM